MAEAEQLHYSEALNISEAFSLLFPFSPPSDRRGLPRPHHAPETRSLKKPTEPQIIIP